MDDDNVVEIMFRRGDRNADVAYRNQTLALERERHRLDQERLAAQREQFLQSLGVTKDRASLEREQANTANQLALMSGISSGMMADAPQARQNEFPAEVSAGVMPGNIFMQRPLMGAAASAAPQGGPAQAQPSTFNVGGRPVQAIPQAQRFTTELKQKMDARQAELDMAERAQESESKFWKAQGFHPAVASYFSKFPQFADKVIADRGVLNLISSVEPVPEALKNRLIETMGAQARAAETPAMTQERLASAEANRAHAAFYRQQAQSIMSKAQAIPGGGQAAAQVLTILGQRGIGVSDPNALTYIASVINAQPFEQRTKDALWDLFSKEIVSKPTAGIGGMLNPLRPITELQIPKPNVEVNNKPPTVTGPPQSTATQPQPQGAIRYTQPMAPPPIIGSDVNNLWERMLRQQQINSQFK